MTDQWFSKSNIVQILLVLFTIAETLINQYLGLGYVGIFFLILFLAVAVIFFRQGKPFPYLLAGIGIAIGFSFGLLFTNDKVIKVTNDADNGISIPVNLWKFSGEIIDNEQEANKDYFKTKVSLISTQGDNGFTSPVQKLVYTLFAPGMENGINQLPLQGVKSTIYVQPLNSSFSNELIYCNYTLLYNSKPYLSSTYFVQINQPTTLLWDFSSRADINYDSLPQDIKTPLESAQKSIFQDDGGFVSPMRRHSESWNYQYLVLNNYKPSAIENIALSCGVSATKEFRQGNSGDEFDFQGYVTLSNTTLYPVNAKSRQ